jgi:hypothetical protein
VHALVLLVAHPKHNSLPAALETLARLGRLGRRGRIVFIQDDSDAPELEEAVQDLVAWHRLHTTRLGLVGTPSGWLAASTPSREVGRDSWGPEMVDGSTRRSGRSLSATMSMQWARHLLDQVSWIPNPAWVDQEHNAVTTFIAAYLVHMEVEELQVMPVIQNGAPIEKLMAVQMAIRTSVPPPHMCVFLRCMLPAMNPEERTAMLAGMKMGAPPEIFAMVWTTAESRLSSTARSTVSGSGIKRQYLSRLLAASRLVNDHGDREQPDEGE